jgi:hypothetical protein
MILTDLTAVLTCKNRHPNVDYCIHSIAGCDPTPLTILVDFGGRTDLSYLQKKFSAWLRVIRVTTRTDPFHKARAINIGLKQARTKFICATDVDQIFQKNFFAAVHDTVASGKHLVLCRSSFVRSLPPDVVPENVAAHYEQLLQAALASGIKMHGEGCCIGLPLGWLDKARGWDEKYIGYGAEDSDVIYRARLSKFKPIVVNDKTSLIHLPHEKQSDYYSQDKYFKPNRTRYLLNKKAKVVVANTTGTWGEL